MGAPPTPLSPAIHIRCYLGAFLRNKTPTLLIKRVAQTTGFCPCGDNVFLQDTLSLLPNGPWALGSCSPHPQGGSLRGDSGVCPHQGSRSLLCRSVLAVTCSGSTTQRSLGDPLRSAQAAAAQQDSATASSIFFTNWANVISIMSSALL